MEHGFVRGDEHWLNSRLLDSAVLSDKDIASPQTALKGFWGGGSGRLKSRVG